MAERTEDDLLPGERAALSTFAVPPPRAGLAARVLAARRRARRRRLLGTAVAALLLLIAGRALWPAPRAGELTAAVRTTVDLGRRGQAVAEAGAALRYRVASNGTGRVEQRCGAVRYRIQAGGPFTVVTPAGEVHVVGTAFTVELKTMNKPLALAAVTTLALVVYEGQVLLKNRHGALAVGAGGRALATTETAPMAVASVAQASTTGAAGRTLTPERQAEQAARAAERERMLRQIAAARNERGAPAPGAGAPAAVTQGSLDKDYVRQQVREIIPLIKECYTNALEEKPNLAGRILMRFTISGEPDIGGLVETVEVQEASDGMKDPALQECMRESMYAMRFKPPKGGGQVVVSYPFVLLASEEDLPDGGGAAPSSPPAAGKP